MDVMTARYADKADWPRGPWDDEPDRVEWRDPATSLPCLVLRAPLGNLCGYVAVPPGHPWHGRYYDDIDTWTAHGGLTYCGSCEPEEDPRAICHIPLPGEARNVWWVGFDCGHAGDLVPGMRLYFRFSNHDVYRDVDYVRTCCTLVAAEAATALS